MRIQQPGIARRPDLFTFLFEGEPVAASPGESIAAALTAAGIMGCRETRAGDRRGVFCGMGVCGECSVLVNGRARRACMEMASPDSVVQRQPALRAASAATAGDGASPGLRDWEQLAVEVLVVGAGPAGLAAARAAAESGAKVLVVDERTKAGGQYFKQPGTGFAVDESRIDSQFREGLALYRSALEAGVECIFGATVWGAFAGPEIAIATATVNQLIRAQRVIVSPGAYERPMPFPGWTRPGVMTTGAAQTLLRAYQTAPGKRVLVAGNGPLNLQVARELDAAGAEVVAVVELAAAPGLRNLPHILSMCLASPGLVLDGIGHTLHLLRSRVPLIYGHAVCQARGAERVESASVVRIDARGRPVPGSERSFEVDAVCLGYGFLAQSEIARALGAGNGFTAADAGAGRLGPDTDDSGRSVHCPEVFVVGDARGLGGARVALSQGALAGAQAAADLGYVPGGTPAHRRARARRDLRRHRRFQAGLWAVYGAPDLGDRLADETTIVCRCEAVTRGQLVALLESGVSSIGAIKRETRAGMGRCQGRYCAALLGEMVRHAGVEVLDDEAFFAPRPPFKPLAIGDLAAAYDASATFNRSAGADPAAGANTTAEVGLP